MIGKVVWSLGIIGWYLIRRQFERKARRAEVVDHSRSTTEQAGLIAATVGLGVVPGLYVATNWPGWARYDQHLLLVIVGAAVYGLALWLFWRSHKDLGRNWSITLEIRDRHRLVDDGIYRSIRHPMYTSFWLMALGQALLLPNWFAGPAGFVGFAVLFFTRIAREEELMIRRFGDEYRAYMGRTKRIIPHVY